MCIRDSSSPFAPDLPTDAKAIGESWKANVETITRAFESMDPERFIHVRYEDLVKHSESTLETLCSFVGEEFSPQMLEFYKYNNDKKLEPSKTLGWKKKTLQPIDQQGSGQYRQLLSASDESVLRNLTSALLEEFGYLG